MMTVLVSLRGRLPASPVRVYGDVGAGVEVGSSSFQGWLVDTADSSTAAMTRTAVGSRSATPAAWRS